MLGLGERFSGNSKIPLTTDGFRGYLAAVDATFGPYTDFAQVVKVFAAEDPGPGRYAHHDCRRSYPRW